MNLDVSLVWQIMARGRLEFAVGIAYLTQITIYVGVKTCRTRSHYGEETVRSIELRSFLLEF